MDAAAPRFFRVATIVWCITPFVAFIVAPPVPFFCAPDEKGIFWYNALVVGAALTFPLCFIAVIASRIAYNFGRLRVAYACLFVPAIGIVVYGLVVLGLRAYWGDAISCLVVIRVPHT
jgi:hypothetical protein